MSAIGQANPFSDASDYNAISFIIARALDEVQTLSIVQVKAVDTGAQTVDVLVLVNLISGGNLSIPHGVISARPYLRLQGGSSAIILDPVAGDIGLMVFASRDLSAVIAAKGAANPGSQRRFSWSDGIYFGGILNADATQYIQFLPGAAGLKVESTATEFTGNVTIDGGLNVTGNTHSGTLHAGNGASGTFTSQDGKTITVVDGIITMIV